MSTTAFEPTLLMADGLCHRLAGELSFFAAQLKQHSIEFKQNPSLVVCELSMTFWKHTRQFLSLHLPSSLVAVVLLLLLAICVSLIDRRRVTTSLGPHGDEVVPPEVTTISLNTLPSDGGIGVNGNGRVGINQSHGEGSDLQQRRSRGGGSGGDRQLTPPQQGKLPVPSPIPAPMPAVAKVNPSLPAAGIDLDPALWRNMEMPRYGDPRSSEQVRSNGPGDGGAIGTNHGTGIGDGDGPGYGPGRNGNTGGNDRQTGCCGSSGSDGNNPDGSRARVLKVAEAETRPRVISKPEPQFTEEARRNLVMGTVVLRVIFASSGEVTQIHAVKSLPFGLTERAIAAARQIRFIPASKGGTPVSVWMQLEYNFNLY